jgi:type II secretory ATPase GspE/PulE/Tfp pilus assembly ATPase PilB-like protein
LISEFLGYKPNNRDFYLYEGKGCPECGETGYRGRIGLYELLVINDALSRGISQGVDLIEMRKIADQSGFQAMFVDGLVKVEEGLTTLAEVMRVTRGGAHESL